MLSATIKKYGQGREETAASVTGHVTMANFALPPDSTQLRAQVKTR
jgi:hypothetical protein